MRGGTGRAIFTTITIIRDPKEVFVSAWHFGGGFLSPQEMLSVDEMLSLLLEDGIFVVGDWAHHTNSFWQWRGRPNVLVLTYEALKKEPRRGRRHIGLISAAPR